MRTRVSIAAGLMGALFCATALADCIEGMREAKPGEILHFKRVSAALKEALPAAPQNWTLAPLREQNIPGLCKDAREGDFDIKVTGTYSYRPPKEEGDRLYAESRKLQSESDTLRQLPPGIAKERQAWVDKASEANRASNRAAKEGNKDLARQKDAEAEEYSKKGREVRNKYLAGVEPQLEQLEARRKALEYGGSAVSVSLAANERYPQSPGPAAGPVIVIGKMPTPKSPGLKVHNVRVIVEGSAAKRAVIEAAIDKAKLARILQ